MHSVKVQAYFVDLAHTHAHSTQQHTERAGGFIRKMALILLSALTNRHLAP